MNRLFIANHARYDLDANHLSEAGHRDVQAMTEQLLAADVDRERCVLMSSVVSYAVETTREVRRQLGMTMSFKSPAIRSVSLWPEAVADVPCLLSDITEEVAGESILRDSDLVVIGHGALIRALGQTLSDLPRQPHCRVYEVPSDWENPLFDPDWKDNAGYRQWDK